MKPEEKKSMIVAIGVGKRPDADADEHEASEDEGAASAFDAFASAAGIPDDKRKAAMVALKSFVTQCSYGDD